MKTSKWGQWVFFVALGLVATGCVMAQGTGFEPPSQIVEGAKKWTIILVVLACIIGLAGGAWQAYRGRFDNILSWVIGTAIAVAGFTGIGILLIPALNNAMSAI